MPELITPQLDTPAHVKLRRLFAPARSSPARRRLVRGLLVAAAAAVALLVIGRTAPLERAEALLYDARARLAAGLVAPDPGIAIIAIDDNSLEVYADVLGRWPWPRDVHAALVQYLYAAGARLVVFDVLFPERDLSNPEADQHFGDVIAASGMVVLPLTFTPGTAAAAADWEAARGSGGVAGREALRRHAVGPVPDAPPAGLIFQYSEPPAAVFSAGARALGAITMGADPDGVVRRERLVYGYQGSLYPSLALAAARAASPERFGGPLRFEPDQLISGQERVPLDRGRLPVRWRGRFMADGRTTYPVYPAFHVLNSAEQVLTGLEPDVPFEAFRNRVVFVGVTATGVPDIRATPLAPHDPGVLIHATILDNLLQGDYLRRAPAWAQRAAVAGAALGVALPVALLTSVVGAAAAGLLSLLAIAAAITAAFAAGVWLELAAPLAAGGIAFAGALGAGYLVEGRDKRRVRELFGRYVSPAYVARLAEQPDTLKLGGERVPLTVLFSDIRGFTSLSERLPAEEVIRLLNQYLDAMAEVVFRHDGTIDKFMGDAVMAFWGAPVPVADHARRAMDAALDMSAELDRLNMEWNAAGDASTLRMGIGIHTGEAVVGNIGSLARKLDYTAIGDTVNLASRLEGLNKEYGTTILVSDVTAAAGGEGYQLHDLGEARVKGKEREVAIYELCGRDDRARSAGETLVPAGTRGGWVGGLAGGVLAALLVGAAVAAVPAPAAAQQEAGTRMQWTAWLYQPGTWRGARVAPLSTRDDATTELALVAVADLYSAPPRWRADIRRVVDGETAAEPVVLVSDGKAVRVLTAMGSTPLAEHAAASERLTALVLGLFDADGRPARPSQVRLVERTASGEVEWITLRRPAARPDVPDRLFATGSLGVLGRRVTRFGIHAVGGERSQEVVASAGARGVVRVRTVDGELVVQPDTLAVMRLAAIDVRLTDLERFMRAAGLGPFAAPATTPARKEEG
jgi:adenylate cyclase